MAGRICAVRTGVFNSYVSGFAAHEQPMTMPWRETCGTRAQLIGWVGSVVWSPPGPLRCFRPEQSGSITSPIVDVILGSGRDACCSSPGITFADDWKLSAPLSAPRERRDCAWARLLKRKRQPGLRDPHEAALPGCFPWQAPISMSAAVDDRRRVQPRQLCPRASGTSVACHPSPVGW